MPVPISPKFSWIPLVGAILLPFVVIGGMLMAAGRERMAEGIDITAPPTGGVQSAFVEVELIHRGGAPATGRAVTFTHRKMGAEADSAGDKVYNTVSDTSGLATLSVPKVGMLSIEVEGMERRTVLPAMEMHGSRNIKVRLTVEP